MSETIEESIRRVGHLLGDATWDIELGSPASTELANTEPGPGGAWGHRPVQTAYAVVRMGILAVTEHARAVALLLPLSPAAFDEHEGDTLTEHRLVNVLSPSCSSR
jgi:hypothetical protein